MRLNSESLHPLRSDQDLVLFRARLWDGTQTALLLSPARDASVTTAVRRIEREYALAGQLSADWAALPLAVIDHAGRPTLVLTDSGGDPLAPQLTGPMPLARFLRIAIGAAGALRCVHGQGLIHRDIKPGNLLADAAGNVHLTGFGIASQLPRERQQIAPPELIDGTLPYMAPEQTGRMNRSTDARSDLYSLGITFYELLCGRLPFTASEPLEWIHCHVARQPRPMTDGIRSVAPGVVAIVMRLLAKSAEERYQTAGGLEADLRWCLDAFERDGAVPAFALGLSDISDRFLMPERLYGRDKEISRLAGALTAVAQTGHPHVVLVSGYAGVGKSALVNELRAVLVQTRGILVAGKFDQYQRDIPYATLGAAFQQVLRRILDAAAADQTDWRNKLLEALGRNAQLLVNLVPELGTLIGEQPPLAPLPPHDEEKRFQRVFRRFLSAFAQAEHPLVLFLDDLQWVDEATLALLHVLSTECPDDFLLIGSYRDNEISEHQPLRSYLAALRQSGITVDELALEPLGGDELGRFIADALHSTPERVLSLSDVIHEKTAGNPFFAGQFMAALAEEGLLYLDHAALAWRWDMERIRTKGFTDNVAELMADRLVRLPKETRSVLMTLACLGSAVPVARLALAHGLPSAAAEARAQEAIQAGLILHASGAYSFAHDRIQEAAYAMVTADRRAQLHLNIARRLAAGLRVDEIEAAVADVVDQYNRGIELVTNQIERNHIAALNLLAGRRARATIALASALGYFEAGERLLQAGGWEGDYGLAFDLAFNAAESHFLNGDHAGAEQRLLTLGRLCRSLVHHAAVTSLLITLYTARDQMAQAVQTCLTFLLTLGIDWPAHPGPDAPREQYEQLCANLAGRPISSLIDLPSAEDPEAQAFLDVLAAVLPPAFFTDQDLVCLVLCRMANVSIEQGNYAASALGYAYLGMVVGPYFGDYRNAYAFGQLGRDLVERQGLPRYEARVQMCFAYHVAPWTLHISSSLPLLRRAFDIAVEVGDLTYSGFCSCSLVTSLIAAGVTLGDVQREAETKLDFVQRSKFGLIADIITSQLVMIRQLRGSAVNDAFSPNAMLSLSSFEERLESEPSLAIAACWHWIRKLQAAVHVADFEEALAAAGKAEPLLWTTSGHFEMAEYHFYSALAHAAVEEGRGTSECSATLHRHQEQLEVWAENCPDNFASRAALVAGAIAAVEGDELVAMRHFDSAIRMAREQRLIQVEALANEWAARFYNIRQFTTIALAYLRNARTCYLHWGATTKVHQLEHMHQGLLEEVTAPGRDPREELLGTLDMASFVRTAQTVSGEIGLTGLIRALMMVVLEHAGAERGLLILPKAHALHIVAEACTGLNGISVRLLDRPVTGQDTPLSILDHAARVQKTVLLDDARRPGEFQEENYFQARGSRSVLCLPLVKQAKLAGLLYLENSLAPYVFTPARISVLKLLASQAAISLENAVLEEKEALLKEMHHRVKNNLQLISSMLNLQASRVADPVVGALFADCRDRVRSMALVHENLYRVGDYARVPMRSHIGSLCGQLQRAYRPPGQNVALVTDIEDLQFDLDRAVASGLIINELVSNAFKHAFPDGREGRILVTLSRPEPGHCRLIVKDTGVGFNLGQMVDPDAATSLGLQLMNDLVHQIHGAVEIVGRPGATFIVTFPFETPRILGEVG